jgi:hypothetical protein
VLLLVALDATEAHVAEGVGSSPDNWLHMIDLIIVADELLETVKAAFVLLSNQCLMY